MEKGGRERGREGGGEREGLSFFCPLMLFDPNPEYEFHFDPDGVFYPGVFCLTLILDFLNRLRRLARLNMHIHQVNAHFEEFAIEDHLNS